MKWDNPYFAQWVDIPGDLGTVKISSNTARKGFKVVYTAPKGNVNFPFKRDTNQKLTNFIGDCAQDSVFDHINMHVTNKMVDLGTCTAVAPWVKTSSTLDFSGCLEYNPV